MRIAFFDTRRFDRKWFSELNGAHGHEITYLEPRLTEQTASLANTHECVCSFVNDRLTAETLERLSSGGVRLVALRCAGYNHVDLSAAKRLGIRVVRVPEYSPYSVAEHAVGLILALNRKLHRAYYRVRELNFSLEGLVGFDLHGRTLGVVGTGKIGAVFAQIMRGFGSHVLATDTEPNDSLRRLGVEYVPLEDLLSRSDIVSLHIPLTPSSWHIINGAAIDRMKPGVMLINTSRGGLVDTKALVEGLKSGLIGSAGLDVYEEEEGVFFHDLSNEILRDDVLARLLTFPNVLITSHQAFLTTDALHNIAATTLANVTAFERGEELANQVTTPD